MTSMRKSFDEILQVLSEFGSDPKIIKKPAITSVFESVTSDSRKVSDGVVFCAIKGHAHDGHAFIESLRGKKALLLVEDSWSLTANPSDAAAIVQVRSTRGAWAMIAAMFCGNPQKELNFIGVTGTNGKTSTVWFVREIFKALNVPVATLGTLGNFLGDEHFPSQHTTPDPDELFKFLSVARDRGIRHVAMEVSSHSLIQEKLGPIVFSAAGFTSFSQDHLDFHSTMDEYFAAKLRLFEQGRLRQDAALAIHESVLRYPGAKAGFAGFGERLHSYGVNPDCSCRMSVKADARFGKSLIEVKSGAEAVSFEIPVIGTVFCENAVAALFLTASTLKRSLSECVKAVARLGIRPVPGRLEPVSHAARFPCAPSVYVDYAHTPDALEKAILNLKAHNLEVVTVFGCGGDRDKTKRPLMGEVATRLSKVVYVTSDNPRSESPQTIIQDILAGCGPSCVPVVDRKEAIHTAITRAGYHDVVLVAGKGHEDYQIIGTQKFPFSDQNTCVDALHSKLNWLVVGAGVSGLAAANFLANHGQETTLVDDKLPTRPGELSSAVTWSGHSVASLAAFDRIIAGPGVALSHPLLVEARGLGRQILTEVDLGLDRFPGAVFAVTGTNGKSTTVDLAHFVLKTLGEKSFACGNIGIPPTTLDLAGASDDTRCVIELSSYQLEGCLPHSAAAAAITSFSPDHLARHKTLENYFAQKWRVTKWLRLDGVFIVSAEVARFASDFGAAWPQTRIIVIGAGSRPSYVPSHCEYFDVSRDTVNFDGLSIDWSALHCHGIHQRINALTAALGVLRMSPALAAGRVFETIAHYRPLPYRCEVVFKSESLQIINDSKSTNVESTLAALSISKRPAILLMGGQGKGESYAPVKDAHQKISRLITFGASGAVIMEEARGIFPVEHFKTMAQACHHALELGIAGGQDVIFSPGCASFDEFRNFEHRGEEFSKIVKSRMSS